MHAHSTSFLLFFGFLESSLIRFNQFILELRQRLLIAAVLHRELSLTLYTHTHTHTHTQNINFRRKMSKNIMYAITVP